MEITKMILVFIGFIMFFLLLNTINSVFALLMFIPLFIKKVSFDF
mgnify:CR=1 FL=1